MAEHRQRLIHVSVNDQEEKQLIVSWTDTTATDIQSTILAQVANGLCITPESLQSAIWRLKPVTPSSEILTLDEIYVLLKHSHNLKFSINIPLTDLETLHLRVTALERHLTQARASVDKLTETKDTLTQQLAETKSQLAEAIQALSRQANPWIHIGSLKDLTKLLDQYPTTKYKYGVNYNSVGPERVMIKTWNRGHRVHFKEFYLEGDNGAEFTIGNAVFTCGTDDSETKALEKNGWYHRYVKADGPVARPFGSNGDCSSLPVYVRKL